jgi:glycosyltransferase involved in cell wall biosynthesis
MASSTSDAAACPPVRPAMSHSLKVAQLVPYHSPVIGGVEVVCQFISEELTARGHDVHVYTANRSHKDSPRREMPADETMNCVHVHRFRSYVNVGRYGFFPGFVPALKSEGFDIVHAHGYRQPQSEIGSRIGSRMHVPTILHAHGGFYTRNRAKRMLYSLYDSAARRYKADVFDHFIALSEGDRQNLLELNVPQTEQHQHHPKMLPRISHSKRSTHPLPAEARTAGQKSNPVSQHSPVERPESLGLLSRLIESEPDVFLLFAGPDAGKFRRFARWGGCVADYYNWLGPLQGKEKHGAYLNAPNSSPRLPTRIPILWCCWKAMAHGKPVLDGHRCRPGARHQSTRCRSSCRRRIWTASWTVPPGC